MLFQVTAKYARAVRRKPGSTITFINQSATDVFFDRAEERLNRKVTVTAADGTKLANTGGQLQWPDFPGVLWFRAASETTIEVIP